MCGCFCFIASAEFWHVRFTDRLKKSTSIAELNPMLAECIVLLEEPFPAAAPEAMEKLKSIHEKLKILRSGLGEETTEECLQKFAKVRFTRIHITCSHAFSETKLEFV